MTKEVVRAGRAVRMTMTLVLCLIVAGLVGCGSKTAPLGSIPPAPGKKAPAPTGKGGTYRPYTINGQTYYPLGSADGYAETGRASWYGRDFHGRKTANGERYDMYQMTAAHRILPMHTRVVVTNLENGRRAEVRINDRGPFVKNRIIDLSYAAASALGVVGPGTARVRLETVPGERILYVGPFYVQYGAFIVEANARNLRRKLADRGYPGTRVVRGELNGTTFWRVQVGAFQSLTDAESIRVRLAKESPDCFIIAD